MKTTLLFSALLIPMLLSAQLTDENFDAYTTGAFDSQWDPNDWVGWFGGTSYANISDVLSSSAPNSLHIEDDGTNATDIVGLFGELNSGVYELTFMQYIPANNGAYYNLQHNYTNTAGDWAAELYFSDQPTGQAQIVTNNTPTIFTPVWDTWVENRFVFNFISETAEFYYNGALVLTWQISTNASGGAGLNQINGINLYAACLGTGCVSSAYYDDILVEEVPLPDFDVVLTDAQRPTGYTMVPDGYVQPFVLGADVANVGAMTVNNLEVTAEIYDGSNTLVHSEVVGNEASLASGASASYSIVSSYTPSSSDDFTIEYVVTIDETDENPSDNEFSGMQSFEITDSIYARDNGVYDNGIGVNNGDGLLGQNFDFIDYALVEGISMSYAGTGIGDTIVGHIFSIGGNGMPDMLMASTKPFILQEPGTIGAEVYETLEFTNPALLEAGNYAFIIEQKGPSNLLLSTTTEIFTLQTTWASTDNGGTWQHMEDIGFTITMNVRPILDATIIDVDDLAAVEQFSVAPNPTNGKTTIFLDLASNEDIRFDVYNIQGQLVKSIKDRGVIGSTQYPLDLSPYAEGMYIVRLIIDGHVVSQKVNLVK